MPANTPFAETRDWTRFDCGCQYRQSSGIGDMINFVYCPLHSAAPELLEALQKVAHWIEVVIGEPDKALISRNLGMVASKQARVAIETARGNDGS